MKTTKLLGVKATRGTRMKQGKKWRLIAPGERVFKATLLKRFNIGKESVAIFKVRKLHD